VSASRRLVPELEARRHLLEGYASFRELPDEVNARWKAPFGPPEDWDLVITPVTVPGPHGPVPVRVYAPVSPAPAGGRPCLVWMHGGAFAWGDLDMPEAHEVARGVAGRADAVVVSVDYRLCPVPPELGGPSVDHPVRYPVPQDDCAAVLDAVRAAPERFGVDPGRIAIGGASAGAALAAGVTVRAAATGRPPWQALLVYPLLHAGVPEPDAELAEALAAAPAALEFPPEMSEAIDRAMLGGGRETATPYAYAGVSDDLSGFPPTYVENSEFDAFRASGHRFVGQLRAAGVDVVEAKRAGVPHGHLDLVGFAPAAATLDALAARLTAR
jgi:xylan 1,4-beta-xylosidase